MNFLCIYLGEKEGGALMHVYVWDVATLNVKITLNVKNFTLRVND